MELQGWLDALEKSAPNGRVDIFYDFQLELYPESTPNKKQIGMIVQSLGRWGDYCKLIWTLKEHGFGSIQMEDE